jgi:hypothetical protein
MNERKYGLQPLHCLRLSALVQQRQHVRVKLHRTYSRSNSVLNVVLSAHTHLIYVVSNTRLRLVNCVYLKASSGLFINSEDKIYLK